MTDSIPEQPDSAPASSFNKKKKIPKKITESYLTNSGKFYLERFPASTEQFRRVMMRKIHKSCKAHPEQPIEQCQTYLETVIAKFQNIGFLNDSGYAAGLARSLKNRGWPRNRIMMRLKEKGISSELVDEIMIDKKDGEDLRDALIWIRRKKLGAFATKDRLFEKSLASLARAGFDYQSASHALSLTKEDIEEILSRDL